MSAALAGVPAAQAQAHDDGGRAAGRCEMIDHTALFGPQASSIGGDHATTATGPGSQPTECHACEKPIYASDDEGFAVPGRGLLVFTRGDERRAEEPRLCASCGAAIGMTMLTRWAIEEDEG